MFEAETLCCLSLKNDDGGNVSYVTSVEKVEYNISEIRKKRKQTEPHDACGKTQFTSAETVRQQSPTFTRSEFIGQMWLCLLLCAYTSSPPLSLLDPLGVEIFQNKQKYWLAGIRPQILHSNIVSPHFTSPTFVLVFSSGEKGCRAGVRCLWHRLFISQQNVAPVSGF